MSGNRCRRSAGFCLSAIALCVAGMVAAVALAQPAAAQKRVALVIGNAAYMHAGRLANPANDASDMAAALKGLGIDVILGLDLDKGAFDAKLREFSRAIAEADAGILYYAGHGLQVGLRNYLIPRKIAEPATKGAIAAAAKRQEATERALAQATAAARESAEQLNRTVLTIAHQAGEDGRLFSRGRTVQVMYDYATRSSKPLPPEVRAALEKYAG